eukprot:Sro439_g143190.2  (327) ;mRNA; f:27467-28447
MDSQHETVTICVTPTAPFSNLVVLCTVSTNNIGCFSEDMTVQVEQRGAVAMKDLSTGDRIMVEPARHDQPPVYQSVYGFGHYHPSVPMEYLQIYTYDSPRTALELSASHLIYAKGHSEPIRADQLQNGDLLLRSSLSDHHRSDYNTTVLYTEIVRIDRANRDGAYLPLTSAGTIVVNGIYTSAYVSISEVAPDIVERLPWFSASEQDLFHWWLAPYRMACLSNNQLCRAVTAFDDEGVLQWLNWGKDLAKFGNRQTPWVQGVGLSVTFAWLLIWIVLEQIFLYRWLQAIMPWLVLASYYAWQRCCCQSPKQTGKSLRQQPPKLKSQ